MKSKTRIDLTESNNVSFTTEVDEKKMILQIDDNERQNSVKFKMTLEQFRDLFDMIGFAEKELELFEGLSKIVNPTEKGTTPKRKSPYKIYIREQSDHYWLNEEYPTLDAAMKVRKKIHDGPLGGGFMVQIFDSNGTQLTER